jgi:hypothetical protein
MFRAIRNLFRAIGYLLTGRIDAARKALSENPYVIEATYDKVIEEKKANLDRYRSAIAGMIVKEEEKKSKITTLSTDVQKYEKLKAGAAVKAKQIVERCNGDIDAVKADNEYTKWQAAFSDYSSSLDEKKKLADEIHNDLKDLSRRINEHKANIQGLLRDLQKIQEEKHSTIADVISAKEEKEIYDMINGISMDRSNKELQELRDLGHQAKATARVSREMAGLDVKSAENELLAYAESDNSNKEFEKLIGLDKPKAVQTPLLDEIILTQNPQNAKVIK